MGRAVPRKRPPPAGEGWRGSCPVAVVVLDGQEGEEDGAGGAGDGDDGAVDDADDGVDQAADDDDSHEVLPTIEWNNFNGAGTHHAIGAVLTVCGGQ